jgi:uncharacterized protein (TIGR02231 family)
MDMPPPAMAHLESSVTNSEMGSATFGIDRVMTILSDNKPHKSTIAMITLQPTFLYFCTPGTEEAAYLQVKTTNTSQYHLLPSEKVSVFLDGSFTTTSKLQDISPGESFNTFLGVDGAIRVEHKQIKSQSSSSGWMTKRQSTKYQYLTQITNTKPTAVTVTVVEILPQSTDDKIKVQLENPRPDALVASGSNDAPAAQDAKDAKADALADRTMQNKITNNIVFVRNIAPQSKIEVPFEYELSWPNEKEVEVVDK